jgi:hypothetical protein
MPKMFYMPYAHVLLCAFYLAKSNVFLSKVKLFLPKKKADQARFSLYFSSARALARASLSVMCVGKSSSSESKSMT